MARKPRRLVDCDDEELQALIDFQLSMAAEAADSCEHEEAERRKRRAETFKKLLASL